MHSLLFVPATRKKLEKINELSADAYIIDLEDSISEVNKADALELTNDFCKKMSVEMAKKIFIRLDSELLEMQLTKLSGSHVKGYMIPKFEDANRYIRYENIFNSKIIIALVETPMAVINVDAIAQTKWIDAIAFGAEDYSASMTMLNNKENLIYARSRIITAAKAFGKKVYDTPSFIINNEDALKEEIQIAVDMGFDGKLSINPKQIEPINSMFNNIDLEYMKEVIRAYDEAKEAVYVYNGKIYEKMHINHMKRIIKESSGGK